MTKKTKQTKHSFGNVNFKKNKKRTKLDLKKLNSFTFALAKQHRGKHKESLP